MAAYLYTLHLDNASLAWEYLRRNAGYAAEFCLATELARGMASPRSPQPGKWGLRHFEDPSRDARVAHPIWAVDPSDLVLVHLDFDPPSDPYRFTLWSASGAKQVFHEGRRLVLTRYAGARVFRQALAPMLAEGEPIVWGVRASRGPRERWSQIRFSGTLLEADEPNLVSAKGRPGATAIAHMRSLMALDSIAEGASHRGAAEALFGRQAVLDRWSEDSELRAQVRRLIRRARAMVAGGYCRLLQHTDRAPGR